MPLPPRLAPTVLEAALVGLQAQRERVAEQIAQVRGMLGGQGARQEVMNQDGAARPGRRQMSAATRKRMAEAQQKRWAAFHKSRFAGAANKLVGKAAAPRKRKLSAAGRNAIAEAARRRWKAFRKKRK